MVLSKSNKKRRQKGFIFRGKSVKPRKRQLFEALLFLTIGINLLLFLQTLPSDFIPSRISKEVFIQFYESLMTLFSTLIGIGVGLIVICLLIFSFILIVGGTIRIIIYISKKKNPLSRRNDI